MAKINISNMDIEFLSMIRKNIIHFMRNVALKYVETKVSSINYKLLDIAPQIHEGASPFFKNNVLIDTFDIDPKSGCTFIGDICSTNDFISNNYYDFIVCTEVLEHTLEPWNDVEMKRILKPGGFVFLSSPFNFRIHGPLPDCWWFSEHGFRALFSDGFEIIEINSLETIDRPLMLIHYTLVAKKI